MKINDYLESLPTKKKLSAVKLKILNRLWEDDRHEFPKPWVSSAELLELTSQKYFDRRTRELRDQLGCDLESAYCKEFAGHGWRLASSNLTISQDREYLTSAQKIKLFEKHDYRCVICGTQISAGVRGLQADHKVPLSRGGGNDSTNWHPMCNNCNVGKRRACQDCTLNCTTCSWAFPEIVGIQTMLNLREETLRRIDRYSIATGKTRDTIMEESANYYLDDKAKGG